MNWRTTWILLGLAGALMTFILTVERHSKPVLGSVRQVMPLVAFKPEEVTSLLVRREGNLFMRVDRTNGQWQVTFPLIYPAHPVVIPELLDELAKSDRRTLLTASELRERGQNIADFGLEKPRWVLAVQYPQGREEFRFGVKTPVGDRGYVQTQDSQDVFVVNGTIFDRLPERVEDWRSTAWLHLRSVPWDRIEVRGLTRGFAIQLDPTNRTFYLSKPTPARADRPKIIKLLSTLDGGRVSQFVNDNAKVDLEPYGLETPQAELVFGSGTNDVVSVWFGNSPTNDPSQVYALLRTHTNVVLVSKSLLEGILLSHSDLREKRLLSLLPEEVNVVEIVSATNLVLRRQGDKDWNVVEPVALPADTELVKRFFGVLGGLEGEVERDVVTDFSSYGLAPPAVQVRLKSVTTNAVGVVTNRLLGQLDFGLRQESKMYVRRADETSLYSIPYTQFEELPLEPWQVRRRQVWSFSTNEVVRVTARHGDRAAVLLRTGPARWELAPGTEGVVNDLAVEETVYRLGQLEAEFWVAQGGQQRSRYALTSPALVITVELKGSGGKTIPLSVEFGQSPGPNQFPYALVELDGKEQVFEFPRKLYLEVVRDLFKPFWRSAGFPL